MFKFNRKNWKRETVNDLVRADDAKWYSTANDRSDELESLTMLMFNQNQTTIDKFRMMQEAAF